MVDSGLLGIGAGFQTAQTSVAHQAAMTGILRKSQVMEEQAVAQVLSSVSLAPLPPSGAYDASGAVPSAPPPGTQLTASA